jgi:ubiquitin carboxyl-terminal hydrolase 10
LPFSDFFSKYNIKNDSISLTPRGLVNNSNYCYINAILQAMVACPPFYHLMRAIPTQPPAFKAKSKTPVVDSM